MYCLEISSFFMLYKADRHRERNAKEGNRLQHLSQKATKVMAKGLYESVHILKRYIEI